MLLDDEFNENVANLKQDTVGYATTYYATTNSFYQ
jgi:hypothetical protein